MPEPTKPPESDPDSFADRVLASLKRRKADLGNVGDDDDGRGDHTANGRIRQLTASQKKLIEEYEAEIVTLKTQIKADRDRMAADFVEQGKRMAQTHAEDLGLVDAGFTDPLGRRLVREAWEMEPKESRGKSAKDWWSGLVEGHKAHLADPEKATAPAVPRALSAYLPVVEQAADKAQPGKAPPQKQASPPGPKKPATGRDPFGDFDDSKGPEAWLAHLAQAGRG